MKHFILLSLITLVISSCNQDKWTQPNPITYTGFQSDDVKFADDQCNDVLKDGVFNRYKFESKEKMKLAIQKFITYSRDQIDSIKNGTKIDADIPIPMAEEFLSFGLSYEDEEKQFQEIKEKYKDSTTINLETSEEIFVERIFASKTIVSAWEKCMEMKLSQKGIVVKLIGNKSKNFIMMLNKIPANKFDPKKAKITSIITSPNIKMLQPINLKKGWFLKDFEGISQSFFRLDSATASIVVNFDGFDAVTLNIPAIIKPKPIAKFEEKWFKEDENGNKYFQVFSFPTEDRHNKGGVIREGDLALTDKSGRIYNVEHFCSDFGGWCYNPNGGYAIKYFLTNTEKNSFRWSRKFDGRGHTDTYIAYYEKKRSVCIENCN